MVQALNKSIATVTLLVCASSTAWAKNADGLQDLVGARAGQAEQRVAARGFTFITSNVGRRGTVHQYWWNSGSRNCVHIVTRDGRYSSISSASRSDCNQKSKGGDVAAAVGVVAGAAILGALLHKKHHKNGKDYDRSGTAQFERGYRDGLHNMPYHNYDRSDSYSDGYGAGIEQRRHNTDYHHGSGGYRQKARFKDLIGTNGRNARSELGRRGFVRVDRFGDQNTRYSIMWRGASRQCLKLTSIDGRVYDIQDIRRNPACR